MIMELEEAVVAGTIAERIRLIREARGISSESLAERAGISAVYMSRVENRHVRKVSLFVALRIAQALGVSISELVGEQDFQPQVDQDISRFKRDMLRYGAADKLEMLRLMLPYLGELERKKTA